MDIDEPGSHDLPATVNFLACRSIDDALLHPENALLADRHGPEEGLPLVGASDHLAADE
jgi:hypothetical protein